MMLNEEQRTTYYQDYVTTALKILAESYIKVHGGEISLPSFVENTHKAEKPKSKEEIMEHVKKLFA